MISVLDPGEPRRRLFVQDYIVVKELVELLGLRPFKVVADVMELGLFKHADEVIDFPTAALVGKKHGFSLERVL